jgi:glutaminyl-tRNA synthetase
VTKDYSWIDYATLDGCLREDLRTRPTAPWSCWTRSSWNSQLGRVFGSADHLEDCHLPALPHHGRRPATAPNRHFTLGREVWIEREDFAEVPPKGYKRLFPGNKVRLKGGYVIECTVPKRMPTAT